MTAARWLPILLCVGTLALEACASSKPANKPRTAGTLPVAAAAQSGPESTDLSAYRLGIGDRIRIDVFGESDLSMDATVDQSGTVNYPLLGNVPAQRRTAGELARAIREGLAAGYLVNPDVRVTVVQYRAFYLTGEVRRPGAYPYVVGLTVEKALALGGGMTDLASTRKIFILREATVSGKRVRVGLDAPVLPGDTLLVEESLF